MCYIDFSFFKFWKKRQKSENLIGGPFARPPRYIFGAHLGPKRTHLGAPDVLGEPRGGRSGPNYTDWPAWVGFMVTTHFDLKSGPLRVPRGPAPFHSHALFRTSFATLFSEPILLQRSVPKGLPLGPPKLAKNKKICSKPGFQTQPWSRHAKRLRLEGVKPSKVTTLTHFELFFQMPRAAEMDPKWEPH